MTDRKSGAATYRILRRLGKGGMAEVFLARQEGMAGFKRLAVVKRLLPQFSNASSVAEMLLDEARIVAQLNHPNIVQIYELGKEENQYFIVMEYVDGADLATLARIERRKKSRVPIRLALRVVSEAAMGLDYAHRHHDLDGRPLNIVHRDVSPHNILCSREGAVKVGDFGIAKAVGKVQVTDVGVVKGKVQYMAPEQYTGSDVDGRADIFSLGVVLYQLTVGRLPRVGQDGQVAVHRVIDGKIPRPSEIRADYPEQLEQIVLRALSQKPADRYPDAASFRDDVLDFARQHDLLAFPKELGDYVESLVPRQPVTGESKRPSTVIISEQLQPEAEDEATSPPAGTERVENLPPSHAVHAPRPTPPVTAAPPKEISAPTKAPSPSEERSSTPVLPKDEPARAAEPERVSAPRSKRPASREERIPSAPAAASRGRSSVQRSSSNRPRPTAPELLSPPTPTVGSLLRSATPTSRSRPPRGRGRGLWIFAGAMASAAIAAALVYFFVVLRPPAQPRPLVTPAGPRSGALELLCDPKTASVSIDGAQRCARTPCRIGGLPLDRELLVTARAAGHHLWIQRVVLTAAEPTILLTPKLTNRRPRAGDAAEPEAKAPANGGKPSAQRPPGKKSAGKPPAAGKTPPSKGTTQRKGSLRVTTVAAESPEVSVVVIDVRPAWAEVWVEGQQVGVTPLQRQIKPGRYKIELKNAQLNYHRTVTINPVAGKKIKISDTVALPQGAAAPPKPGQ